MAHGLMHQANMADNRPAGRLPWHRCPHAGRAEALLACECCQDCSTILTGSMLLVLIVPVHSLVQPLIRMGLPQCVCYAACMQAASSPAQPRLGPRRHGILDLFSCQTSGCTGGADQRPTICCCHMLTYAHFCS